MHVVGSYRVAAASNNITAPRRLATLSVGSMGKTPRLGCSKIRAIDSWEAYGRPMGIAPPSRDARSSAEGSRSDFTMSVTSDSNCARGHLFFLLFFNRETRDIREESSRCFSRQVKKLVVKLRKRIHSQQWRL